jgi:hypothetical protein
VDVVPLLADETSADGWGLATSKTGRPWHTPGMGPQEFLRQLRLALSGACLMVLLAWFLVSARLMILTVFG